MANGQQPFCDLWFRKLDKYCTFLIVHIGLAFGAVTECKVLFGAKECVKSTRQVQRTSVRRGVDVYIKVVERLP